MTTKSGQGDESRVFEGVFDDESIEEIKQLYKDILSPQDMALLRTIMINILKHNVSIRTFPHPKGLWVWWNNKSDKGMLVVCRESNERLGQPEKNLLGKEGVYYDGPIETGVQYHYSFFFKARKKQHKCMQLFLGPTKEEYIPLHEIYAVWPHVPTKLEALIDQVSIVKAEGAIVGGKIDLLKRTNELYKLNNPTKSTNKPKKSKDDYSSLNEELGGIEKETQLRREQIRRKLAKGGTYTEDDFVADMENIEETGQQRVFRTKQKWQNKK